MCRSRISWPAAGLLALVISAVAIAQAPSDLPSAPTPETIRLVQERIPVPQTTQPAPVQPPPVVPTPAAPTPARTELFDAPYGGRK